MTDLPDTKTVLVVGAGAMGSQIALVAALAGHDVRLADLDATDAAVAVDPRGQAELWRLREGQAEAIATLGSPHKLDVTLPAAALAAFVEDVPGLVTSLAPAARTWLFGHAADGNIHVNVTGLDADDETVDDAVRADLVSRIPLQ